MEHISGADGKTCLEVGDAVFTTVAAATFHGDRADRLVSVHVERL